MTERRNSCSWARRKILIVFSIAFTSVPAWAHSPKVAANITIEHDGRFSLNLTFDLPPFICQVLQSKANDNVLNAWLDGPTDALIAGLAAAQVRFQNDLGREPPHFSVPFLGRFLVPEQSCRVAFRNTITAESLENFGGIATFYN